MSSSSQVQIWLTDVVHGAAPGQITSCAVIRVKPGCPRLVVFSQVSRFFTGTTVLGIRSPELLDRGLPHDEHANDNLPTMSSFKFSDGSSIGFTRDHCA